MPVDTFYAEQKMIENTQPGWWIQTWDDDGSESWMKVMYVASVTHIETGRKATVVRGVDQEGRSSELREWNGSPITALTAARAKKAGLQQILAELEEREDWAAHAQRLSEEYGREVSVGEARDRVLGEVACQWLALMVGGREGSPGGIFTRKWS